MDDLNSRLLTLQQVARATRVPADWLRSEADAGRIPALRAGDRLLFDLSTVQRIVRDLATRTERAEGSR